MYVCFISENSLMVWILSFFIVIYVCSVFEVSVSGRLEVKFSSNIVLMWWFWKILR